MLRAVTLCVVIAVPLASCARSPEPFAPDRTVWNSSGISDYDFSIIQFSAWSAPPPVRVVVRSQPVQSATMLCLPPGTEDFCRAWLEARKDRYGPDGLINHAKSISQLFDVIASTSQSDPKARIDLVLDPTYGFPASFRFDNPDTDDDEYGFQITDFVAHQ